MNNERLDGLLTFLGELEKLNSSGDYRCIDEIGVCIKWISEEFEKVTEVSSFTTEQLADVLLSRDGVAGGRVHGPCKWELLDGGKATLIVIDDVDSE